jgi:hypothetical protein
MPLSLLQTDVSLIASVRLKYPIISMTLRYRGGRMSFKRRVIGRGEGTDGSWRREGQPPRGSYGYPKKDVS